MPKEKKKDIWLGQFQPGYDMVEQHPIFGPLLRYVHVSPVENAQMKGAAYCGDHGYITVSRKIGTPKHTDNTAGKWIPLRITVSHPSTSSPQRARCGAPKII